jgi:prepilin-type processing-associated H-X9-DG protein
MGHNILTIIAPYIEQGNLLNIARIDRSVIDPLNFPPPYGTSIAGGTKIAIYACPSSQDRQGDYGPYFVSQGLPNLGPLLLGITDYNIIRGLDSTFPSSCAPAGTPINTDSGPFGAKGEQRTIQSIGDGTSNTIMFAETAGRPQIYFRGTPQPTPAGALINSAWADYNTSFRLSGYGSTPVPGSGCDTVGAANYQSMYSFHTAGVNIARCDGSVAFLKNSTSGAVAAAIVTANGGEVVPGDAW